MMRAVGRPAVGDGVEGFAAHDGGGLVPTGVFAEEHVALRVETGQLFRAGEIREVIATLAILGLVVDDVIHDFDLTCAEVALEVGGVVLRIPEAEFDAGEDGELGGRLSVVGHHAFPDLERLAQRHEISRPRLDALADGADGRVAHAVAALVFVELAARGLPRRRPKLGGGVVAEVKIAPAVIERRIVVAVARDAAQARVAVVGVAASGVGDDAEVGLAAEVIDPRHRRLRPGDHVFAILVVKVSVTHKSVLGVED